MVRAGSDLPVTGQTACYDAGGSSISCSGTGQDGAIQHGISWPSPRFTDNSNGTVTDNLTGLMWEKRPGGGNDGTGAAAEKTWSGALDYASALALGTHSDWRLPNVIELDSLFNGGVVSTGDWLESFFFENVNDGFYWASTSSVPSPEKALGADFHYANRIQARNKTGSGYAWAVRDSISGTISLRKTGQTSCHDSSGSTIVCAGTGQDGEVQAGISWVDPRFSTFGDDIIVDNLTGLVWQKQPAGDAYTWINALLYIDDWSCGGFSDWRLPNRNELRTLVHYGVVSNTTWLSDEGFSSVLDGFYYSTTTLLENGSYIYAMKMSDGTDRDCGKEESNAYFTWGIRGSIWE